MTAETSNARGEVEYEYEVWQHGAWQAGGRENDYASAQSEANHYAMMYAPDGPVEVRIYEKRLLSTTQQYGISPECDAQPLEAAPPPSQESAMDKHPADDEVVFIDGVGAARSSIKSCRDGVQWIKVGDSVYWPLSDSDAKRLHSACCGNGSFDGPTTPADDALSSAPQSAPVGVEGLARLLERIRDLLDSLPVDCLGSGTDASGQPYPIRDEVIHGITKALAQQPAAAHEPCAAVAAIQFALTDPEGMTFLRLWNDGEFDTLRREWPDALRKVYDGADPLAAQHQEPTT